MNKQQLVDSSKRNQISYFPKFFSDIPEIIKTDSFLADETNLFQNMKNNNSLWDNYATQNYGLIDIPFAQQNQIFFNTEDKSLKLLRELKSQLSLLSDLDDIQLQIQYYTPIVLSLRKVTKIIDSKFNGYRKQLSLLLHDAIKRNCGEFLFSGEHINLFEEVIEVLLKEFISESEFDEIEEKFYHADLEVMPTWG